MITSELTIASGKYELGTQLQITNKLTKKTVVATVTDKSNQVVELGFVTKVRLGNPSKISIKVIN